MVLLLGHLEDGRGQWEREGSSAGLWNECVLEKLPMAQRQFACVESWIRMFFQVSGVFFGIRRNFAGLRSGMFFRPKEHPGIIWTCSFDKQNTAVGSPTPDQTQGCLSFILNS